MCASVPGFVCVCLRSVFLRMFVFEYVCVSLCVFFLCVCDSIRVFLCVSACVCMCVCLFVRV